MLKSLTILGCLASMLCVGASAHAQALPTATARGSLQAGAGFTYAKPDYGQISIKGVSAFADFDIAEHLGVEADIHYIALVTPTDLAENSYLIGPRFLLPHGRYTLYGKALVGIGDLVIQEQQDNMGQQAGGFFAYALGGGIDIRATDRITVRAIDVETQHWSYQTGLTPLVVTIGAAYRFR
jgi:Outer membrane protein beta-barrel domain